MQSYCTRRPAALANYLTARRCHNEARRAMARAERMFRRLARRIGDEEAYRIAGVELADARSVRACQREKAALENLARSLTGADYITRLLALGALLGADVPRAANER